MVHRPGRLAICDLDGTLLDSDAALAGAFLANGVPADRITYGHVVAEECARWEISLDDYLAAYDASLVRPFDGVAELVDGLDRWAICSNKHPVSGRAELERFGWTPDVALFADAFDGPKSLAPVLDALGVEPSTVVFVGDTEHDRACAREVGATFVLAGWNPRAAARPGDVVLEHPLELLELLAQSA